MDRTTGLALRAIISGLHQAGAIDQSHISAIVENIAAADAKRANGLTMADRVALRGLCMEIAGEAKVECPIKHLEPPYDQW